MFRLPTYDLKNKHLSNKIIKINHIVAKALTQIRYQSTHYISSVKKLSQTTSEEQSIQNVLNRFEKGYLVMKHSPNTLKPHPKLIYISRDLKFLCWKNPQKNNQKSIALETIKKIVIDNSSYYMRSSTKKDESCCLVIIATERNLQIEASSSLQALVIKQQLIKIVKHTKNISQNYKYTQI